MSQQDQSVNQSQILGHPVGLFILFFTEMWERFSYYGMRALLILFLVAKTNEGGWGWERSEAYALFGWYVMLVYFLPLLGGWIADNKWGHVKTVVVGATIITLGHAAMAIADLQIMGIDLKFVFYVGLFLIVLGTGLFKPNMSSIVGKMYPPQSNKKDGAYTIFYMGVNSGAFIGTLLVGWIGETFSWSYGFGLAGIFMLFGLLQFYFARSVFGKEASTPKPKVADLSEEDRKNEVPFSPRDKTLSIIGGTLAVTWIVEGITAVVTRGFHFLPQDFLGTGLPLSTIFFLTSIAIFIVLGSSRLKRFDKVERDRLKVVFIIATFVIFFWASFEQAGTTMNIFARDYTNRQLTDLGGIIYKLVDVVLSLTPLILLTWVIVKLFKSIFKKYPLTVVFTSLSFLIIWYLVLVRVLNKLLDIKTPYIGEVIEHMSHTSFSSIFNGNVLVDTSWFQILNPFFIVILAPLFSSVWKRFTFSGPQKFFIGFTFLSIGFGLLALGASGIPAGAETASVGMIWLILAFYFHTMGELAISPVGLSYVSKLVPARMMAFMFGIWYIFIGLAGKLASIMAEYSDKIAEQISISGFFLIFTFIPFTAGVVMLLLNKPIKRMMHGVDK